MTTPERDPNPPTEAAGWHDPACGCDACEEDWARKRADGPEIPYSQALTATEAAALDAADEREPDARDYADEGDMRNEWEV